jgi:ATP-dependent helicase HrpB
VLTALREQRGDILAFLPGAGEIRSCQRRLEETVPHGIRILPLYGDLPFAEQERALVPGPDRRVILATAIAETSLTIQGIDTVVDGGFSRRLRFNPATGLNRLVTTRVTAASADQRAGRAGRLGPGVCYRLWTSFQQQTLLPFDPPEILCADLAPLALDLASWGVSDPRRLAWLDPPPEQSYRAAVELLQELGALDGQGLIADTGRRMARLPVHPRLARMLLDAGERGLGGIACDLAAILGERDPVRDRYPSHTGHCDLTDRLEALAGWRLRQADGQVDGQACRTIDRLAREYRRLTDCSAHTGQPDPEAVASLLLLAYPDRIGRRRDGAGRRYLLANGRGAVLSPRSSLHEPRFLVAPVVDGGEQGDGTIMLASTVPSDLLRRECAARIVQQRSILWDPREGRVVARSEERIGAVTLTERPATPHRDEVIAALLAGIAVGPGLAALSWSRDARQFQARVQFIRRATADDGWPDLSDGWLLAHLPDWLGPFLDSCRSLSDLQRIDLLQPLKSTLSWEQQRRLDEGAPARISVPSGSQIALDYDTDGPPVLAVKLQELFGLADTPTVAWGRVPVLLHLLSPARRPIQVTQDLRRFWDSVYHEVKRELKGRYPKHPWPDDPWHAVPTRHIRPRQG